MIPEEFLHQHIELLARVEGGWLRVGAGVLREIQSEVGYVSYVLGDEPAARVALSVGNHLIRETRTKRCVRVVANPWAEHMQPW